VDVALVLVPVYTKQQPPPMKERLRRPVLRIMLLLLCTTGTQTVVYSGGEIMK
jgi:hypothetical protein